MLSHVNNLLLETVVTYCVITKFSTVSSWRTGTDGRYLSPISLTLIFEEFRQNNGVAFETVAIWKRSSVIHKSKTNIYIYIFMHTLSKDFSLLWPKTFYPQHCHYKQQMIY